MHLCHNGKSILHVRKGEAKNAGGAPVLYTSRAAPPVPTPKLRNRLSVCRNQKMSNPREPVRTGVKMRADRKKPKVVPARKPIAKATNDIAHGVSKSGARISCACRPIICSYAPARRRGDENAVSGHVS